MQLIHPLYYNLFAFIYVGIPIILTWGAIAYHRKWFFAIPFAIFTLAFIGASF